MFKIQASSVHRIINCPYSLQLEKLIDPGFKNDFRSFAASFGSDMHDIAEKRIKSYVDGEKAPSIRTMVANAGYEEFTVEFDKGFKAVDLYERHIRGLINKYKGQPYFKIDIEEKIKFKFKKYELVAKMDFMLSYVKDDVVYIHIADLKTGVWDYSESAYNQMVFTIYLYAYKHFKDYKNFYINIHTVQPNYYVENLKIVKDYYEINSSIPKESLDLYLSQIESYICKPGSYCKFCPTLLICPEIIKYIIHIEEGGNMSKKAFEQLEEIYSRSEYIKTYLKTVEEFLIENEDQLKSYRVKHNKKSKKLIKVENPFQEV